MRVSDHLERSHAQNNLLLIFWSFDEHSGRTRSPDESSVRQKAVAPREPREGLRPFASFTGISPLCGSKVVAC